MLKPDRIAHPHRNDSLVPHVGSIAFEKRLLGSVECVARFIVAIQDGIQFEDVFSELRRCKSPAVSGHHESKNDA
jgi:hypothetical protein